jgi:hypothetical protein
MNTPLFYFKKYKHVKWGEIEENDGYRPLTKYMMDWWVKRKPTDRTFQQITTRAGKLNSCQNPWLLIALLKRHIRDRLIVLLFYQHIFYFFPAKAPSHFQKHKPLAFGTNLLKKKNMAPTITTRNINVLYDQPRLMNDTELIKCGSFPLDYDFLDTKPLYSIGMCVPPLMMARIVTNSRS